MRKIAILIGTILMLILCISFYLPAKSFSQTTGLNLWNTLGSRDEVLDSAFGPDFQIVEDGGEVLFPNGVFDGALATTGGTANLGPAGGYLLMNPDNFFAADKTRGTVELWAQKRLPNLIAFQTPVVTFFGASRFASGYISLQAAWHIGVSGPGFVYFNVYDGDWHSAIDYGWEAIPVGQWVHMAFVWDGAGIEGGPDDVRIYRDGVVVASHQGRFSTVVANCCVGYSCGENICPNGYEVRILANHEGRRNSGCPENPSGYCPTAYMDNIKVWDYAKTNFSDRFIENPSSYFSDFTLKNVLIKFKKLSESDSYYLKGRFTLNKNSDGIDPLKEDVNLKVGTSDFTIPAGSFSKKGWRKYKFKGRIGGVSAYMRLTKLKSNSYYFMAWINGVDLTGTPNPVPIGLSIGDDSGQTDTWLKGILKKFR